MHWNDVASWMAANPALIAGVVNLAVAVATLSRAEGGRTRRKLAKIETELEIADFSIRAGHSEQGERLARRAAIEVRVHLRGISGPFLLLLTELSYVAAFFLVLIVVSVTAFLRNASDPLSGGIPEGVWVWSLILGSGYSLALWLSNANDVRRISKKTIASMSTEAVGTSNLKGRTSV